MVFDEYTVDLGRQAECDLERCQRTSAIHLSGLCFACDCWPSCVIRPQVSPNKHFNVQ